MPKAPSGHKRPGQNSVCPKCLDKGHRQYECPSIQRDMTKKGSSRIKFMKSKEAHTSKKKKTPQTTNREPEEKRMEISPMEFEHEEGSISPEKAQNLLRLLTGIRDHLSKSKSTRTFYIAMAKEMYDALPSGAKEDSTSSIPNDQDFENYIKYRWPKVKTFNGSARQEKFPLGYVYKGLGTPHTIHIRSDVIMSAEKAAVNDTKSIMMELQLYNVIIMVIILHGLAHDFAKIWFKEAITPLGVGIGRPSTSGGSGLFIEEAMMGGKLEVEWEQPMGAFDMDLIDHVLIRSDAGDFILSADMARDVLGSLRGSIFHPPCKNTMVARAQRLGGSIQAPVRCHIQRW